MMRVFSIDLVNHLARCRSADAVELAPEIQRFLGVGNGSALGLVLFVNNHPHLVHHWLTSREQAIVGALRLELGPRDARLARLIGLLARAAVFRDEDRMDAKWVCGRRASSWSEHSRSPGILGGVPVVRPCTSPSAS